MLAPINVTNASALKFILSNVKQVSFFRNQGHFNINRGQMKPFRTRGQIQKLEESPLKNQIDAQPRQPN